MSQWPELLHAALLGTQRAAPPPAGASALADLPTVDGRERQLLAQAGALDLLDQVGWLPPAAPTAAPPPALVERLPVCAPVLAEQLEMMLDGRFQELLRESLALLAAAGQRVPAPLLPALLDRAARLTVLRLAVLPVLGARGRWLAAQNPAWEYVAALDSWDAAQAQWLAGDARARQALLGAWRQIDPARGLALLESSWRAEPDAARSLLIRQLDAGLSLADEPFLELALDDRHLLVRQKASELLSSLPGSALCRRMQAHAAAVFSWDAARGAIAVRLPEALPAQLARDGVTASGGQELARQRSQQLMQLVSATPLDWWPARLGVPPAAIVRGAAESRWPRTIGSGLQTAARRQRSAAWARVLLAAHPPAAHTAGLVALLPADEVAEMAAGWLAAADPARPLAHDAPLFRLFRHWTQDWEPPLARFWLAALAQHIAADREPHAGSALRLTLQQFARHCPPALADEAAAQLLPAAEASAPWRGPVTAFLTILRFRQRLHRAVGGGAVWPEAGGAAVVRSNEGSAGEAGDTPAGDTPAVPGSDKGEA